MFWLYKQPSQAMWNQRSHSCRMPTFTDGSTTSPTKISTTIQLGAHSSFVPLIESNERLCNGRMVSILSCRQANGISMEAKDWYSFQWSNLTYQARVQNCMGLSPQSVCYGTVIHWHSSPYSNASFLWTSTAPRLKWKSHTTAQFLIKVTKSMERKPVYCIHVKHGSTMKFYDHVTPDPTLAAE